MHQCLHLVIPIHPVVIVWQCWPSKWMNMSCITPTSTYNIISLSYPLWNLSHIVWVVSRIRMNYLLHIHMGLLLDYLNCWLLSSNLWNLSSNCSSLAVVFHCRLRWNETSSVTLVSYYASQISISCMQISRDSIMRCVTSRSSFCHWPRAAHNWILRSSIKCIVLSILISHLWFPRCYHCSELISQRSSSTSSSKRVIFMRLI